SGFSATHTITIDTTAPTAPSITHIEDNVGTTTGNIAKNGITDDNTPTVRVSLTGTGAEIGNQVKLYNGAKEIGTITLTATTVPAFIDITTNDLADGDYDITARVIDKAGNVGALSVKHTITVDATAPTAPRITSVTDNVEEITGSIADGGTTNDNTPTVRVSLTGTGADVGSTVKLYNGTNEIGTATFTTTVPAFIDITTNNLADGDYDITARVIDKAGNVGAFSATHEITIDTEAPTKPNIVRIIDDVGSITDDVGKNGYTDDNEPTVRVNIAGTDAESGDKVRLYTAETLTPHKEKTLDATDISNNYIDITTSILLDGPYRINARIIDKAGNLGDRSALHVITVDTVDPTVVISRDGTEVAIKAGKKETLIFTLGDPSENFIQDDITVTIGGNIVAHEGILKDFQTVSPRMYKVDFHPSAGIKGKVEFSVAKDKFTDAAGNQNEQSSIFELNVDTMAPSISIAVSEADKELAKGETATVIFTFDEQPYNIDTNDALTIVGNSKFEVTGGTLSNIVISGASKNIYTATFTPTNAEGSASIVVQNDAFQNDAGNKNVDQSDDNNKIVFKVDTVSPTVDISSNTNQLKRDQDMTITFSLNEVLNDFTLDDITIDLVDKDGVTIANDGVLTGFAVNANDPTEYTATLSVKENKRDTIKISISIAQGAFKDVLGNDNVASNNTLEINVDAIRPIARIITTVKAVKSGGTDIKIESSETGDAYLVAWRFTRAEIVSALDRAIDLETRDPTEVKKINVTAGEEASIAVTGLKDGTYQLFTVDGFGNVSEALPIGNSINIDNSAPTIGLVTPAWGAELSSREAQDAQTVTITITDMNIIGQEVTFGLNSKIYKGNVDSSNQAKITIASADLQVLPTGDYAYTINVTDIAGNIATEKTGSFTVAKEQLFIVGTGGSTRLITFYFDGVVTSFAEEDIKVENGSLVFGTLQKINGTNNYTVEVTQNTNGGTHKNIAITVAAGSFQIDSDRNTDTVKNITSLDDLSQLVADGFDFVNFNTSHADTAVRAFQGAVSF
ncbi:MAG: hypothetical protein FE834_04150, partial [Gammaproteobacteria bacterium]|nr:hypothetical protein [Gammaproteobacteria bacterium]